MGEDGRKVATGALGECARPDDHVPTLFQRPDHVHAKLNVCVALYNSARYRSRWRLTEDFMRMVDRHPNARLCIAEIAFGEREYVFASATNPYHLRLRTWHELFFKENALNLLFGRILAHNPHEEYFAWVDADTHFARYDFVDETIQQLQHFPAVQMWSQMQDLTLDHEVLGWGPSLIASWLGGGKVPSRGGTPYYGWRTRLGDKRLGPTGLAWAARREWLDGMGGLLDICLVGSCDWYMGYALIGELDAVLNPKQYHPEYIRAIKEWERRAITTQWKERPLQKNVGLVKGLALHYFHGPKVGRRYQSREQIFQRHQFNPFTDLKRDAQGLWQLNSDKPALRRALQTYYAVRDEDHPGNAPGE